MKQDIIRDRLEAVLSEPVRISETVLIYGAGNSSMLYAECFWKENLPITHYVDRSPEKIGTIFQGKPVISPEEMAAAHKSETVLICTGNAGTYRSIKRYLDEADMESLSVDTYVFRKNKDKVLAVYDLLCDEVSKATYANMIQARMGLAEVDLSLITGDSYFAVNTFSLFSAGEVYVDCGAYVGDTIEKYLFTKQGVFGKVFAFEPEPRNFAAMAYRTERLKQEWALSDDKITLVQAGIGEKSSMVYVSGEGNDAASLSASLSENASGTAVRICSIDDYFAEQRITFLKADIESYEEKMLLGAKNVIRRDRPKIALCIYHNASDMFTLPLMLAEMDCGYHFSVRQHYGDLTDTVLYAY